VPLRFFLPKEGMGWWGFMGGKFLFGKELLSKSPVAVNGSRAVAISAGKFSDYCREVFC
jgi:hypothetical protein